MAQVGESVTGYRISDSPALSIPVIGDTIKWLYNPDIQNARQNAFKKAEELVNSQEELTKTLQQAAKKYPKFRDIMIKQGYMTPDGKINYQKMVDTGYLKHLKNMMKDAITQIDASINKQAALQTAKSPAGISSTSMANLKRKALLDTQRKLLQQYARQVKGERESAYQKALGLGSMMASKEQQDFINKYNYIINSKKSDIAKKRELYNLAAQYAASQSKGIFQDPEKLLQLAGTIAKIV